MSLQGQRDGLRYIHTLLVASTLLVGCATAGANPPLSSNDGATATSLPATSATATSSPPLPDVTTPGVTSSNSTARRTPTAAIEGPRLPTAVSTLPVKPLTPAVEAAMLRLHSWSPDSEMLAYWAFSPEEAAVDYTYPPGTLHFLNIETNESCQYPLQVGYGYEVDRVTWLAGGRVLIVTQDQEVYVSTPCGDELLPLTDVFPAPIHSVAAFTSDRSVLLLKAEEGYLLYEPESHSVREIAGAVPVSLRAGYSWSPSEQYLGITDVTGMPAHFEMSTFIVDVQTGELAHTAEWRHPDVEGSFAGPTWLGEEAFLILKTLDQGPLLVNMSGEVTQIAPTLFGIPATRDQTGAAALVSNSDRYHLALWDSTLATPVLLYHSESNEVEEVSLPTRSWLPHFSSDGHWLTFLAAPTEPTGAYEVWLRPVDPAGGESELLATAQGLPNPLDSSWSEIVVVSPERVSLLSSEGLTEGVWTTGQYQVHTSMKSPGSTALALLGYIPSANQEALFILPLP